MKKLITLAVVALVGIAGAFAFDLAGIQGTWTDSRWDADWTFRADGHIILTYHSDGEQVFDFNDSNIQNFKPVAGLSGAGFEFDCKATGRHYKFVKGLSADTSLDMTITPNWDQEEYSKKITLKK